MTAAVPAFLILLLAQDKPLVQFADDPAVRWNDPVWSADGKRVAFRVTKDDRQHIVVDGRADEPCDGAHHQPRLSPDGSSLAYVATRGMKNVIVRDGKVVEEADQIEHVQWTPDGKLARALRSGERWTLVVGDARTELAGGPNEVVFAGKNAGWIIGGMVTVNGRSEPLDSAMHLTFGPDGTPAHVASKSGVVFIIAGGRKVMDRGDVAHPAVGPGGKLAFHQRAGREWALIVDGREVARDSTLGVPVWSPDGSGVACGGRRHMFAGAATHGPHDAVAHPTWSPDGKRFAYAALAEGAWHVVVGDRKIGPFKRVGPPVFAGGKLAFGTVTVADGKVSIAWKTVD